MNRREVCQGFAAVGIVGTGGRAMAADGFFVPAEEEPHELTFMQWPASRLVYGSPGYLRDVQQTIADVANAIAAFEPVIMLADAGVHSKARQMLSASVELWDVPTEDLWCRDSGPIFAINDAGDLAVRHIQFNGWGNNQVHRRDGRIAETVAARLGVPVVPSGLKGEGAESRGFAQARPQPRQVAGGPGSGRSVARDGAAA